MRDSLQSAFRTHGSRIRVTELLVLVLFVVGQLSATVHHSFVEHTVCAVDGQLAHGEHDHDHGAQDELAEERDAPVDGLRLAPWQPDEGHDAHCSVPTVSEERQALFAVVLERCEARPAQASSRPLHSQIEGSLLPVYRLAPKQSPPVLA